MTLTIRIRGDRQTIQATTAYELVGKMNEFSLADQRDQRAWMKEAARRAETITGMTIRSDSAAHFIDDLISADLVAIISTKGDN